MYGIIDSNLSAMIQRDFKHMDLLYSIGDFEGALRIANQIEDLRQLDFQIRKQQVQSERKDQ